MVNSRALSKGTVGSVPSALSPPRIPPPCHSLPPPPEKWSFFSRVFSNCWISSNCRYWSIRKGREIADDVITPGFWEETDIHWIPQERWVCFSKPECTWQTGCHSRDLKRVKDFESASLLTRNDSPWEKKSDWMGSFRAWKKISLTWASVIRFQNSNNIQHLNSAFLVIKSNFTYLKPISP